MRRLLAVAALASCALAVGSAQAASQRVTLSVAGSQVLYGHQVTVAGHVISGRAGQQVTIFARPYGATAASPVASVVTRRGGTFRYFARPTIQTSYTAHYGSVISRTITVGVRPLLTLHELSNGEIQAGVQADRSFRGRLLKLQQQQADAGWKTIVQRPLRASSTVIFAPTLASSHIRVAFSVNDAGKGYLGSVSGNIVYRSFDLTIRPESPAVVYGKSTKLAGHLVSGKAGQAIEIFAKRYGATTAIRLATATTTAGGWWKLEVSPRIMTRYHAVWSGTEQSQAVVVGVRPVLTIRELDNGLIRAHVQAGSRSFRGRNVKLQQQGADGSWQTVRQAPLDGSSTVLFAAGPTSRLRIVMSVNEAGKGYLGAYSRVLAYRAK